MSQFYEVDANFFDTTTEELNRVALERGGVLKSIGYGYAVRGKSILAPRPDGWSAKWINTRGMGNHGTLVLVTDGLPDDEESALREASGLVLDIFYVGPAPKPEFLDRLARAAKAGSKAELASLSAGSSLKRQVSLLLSDGR